MNRYFNGLWSAICPKLRLILIPVPLFGLVLSFAALAAPNMHPNAERLKAAGTRTLTMTRFQADQNFRVAQSLLWDFEDGKYRAKNRLHTVKQVGFSDCESLLAKHQYFPLNKMGSTGYISVEDIRKYIAMSLNFNPETVDFFLTNRELPVAEAKQIFGDEWSQRLNPFLENALDSAQPSAVGTFVTGSMWSVGGQYLNVSAGTVDAHLLPWQYDPLREELAAKFDRGKYPIVFEWGRTAQDLPGEVTPVASLLAATNYQEVLALGAPLADAYVMFHSFDPVNTALYNRYFPGSLYPSDWADKSDALFLVPLAAAIKRFPPHVASARVSHLIETSKAPGPVGETVARLDDITALNFIHVTNQVRYTELDVYHPNGRRYRAPLSIRDMSIVATANIAAAIHRVGFDHRGANGQALMTDVYAHLPAHPIRQAGQYPDLADFALTGHAQQQKNAVEISNLDVQIARIDSLYVVRVLLGVMNHYADLAKAMPGFDLAWMKSRETLFAITTSDPELAQKIEALGPSDKMVFPARRGQKSGDSTDWQFRGSLQTQNTYWFTIDQLQALKSANPQLELFRLDTNLSARRVLLSDLEPF